jgi:hypothetical protein
MRPNPKNQTLLDIPEIAADFWKLWDTFLKPRMPVNLDLHHQQDSNSSKGRNPDVEFPQILLVSHNTDDNTIR